MNDGDSSNVTSSNQINQTGYLDPSRSVESYNASLGHSADLNAFLAEARLQSKDNWNPQLTADAVNNYIREGFGVGSSPSPQPQPQPSAGDPHLPQPGTPQSSPPTPDYVNQEGFDPQFYLAQNPDVAAAHMDPYQHYLKYGAKEGRDPNPYFDTKYYLAHNADVAAAGMNPLLHYDKYGWEEGRDPSAQFNTDAYLAANPDVAAAHMNPMLHYENLESSKGAIPPSMGMRTQT